MMNRLTQRVLLFQMQNKSINQTYPLVKLLVELG
jgi:hypothetical protein